LSLLSGDPLTQLAFSVYENKGVFALLLGSGISRAAEIPTGWEITLDLVRRVAVAGGVEDQSDWAQWYRDEEGEEPNYSTLLKELAASPEERRSILHSYIEPTEEDREEGRKVPTAAHHAVADLVQAGYVKVIVTTNFDRLLENALREKGVEPTVVASVDALNGAEPITHTACYILKLHGDYKDARILNTDEELGDYPPEYVSLLDRIFDDYGQIVSGWSGEWDHALRAALMATPNRRYPMFWAARGEPGEGARELISQRGARVISVSDADGFFNGIRERVKTLADTHRENPVSIELLVSSTKRYLAKPEYRIKLDDLISREVELLCERIDIPDFVPGGGWNEHEFRNRVARYEAATESLARVAGVLGRWGDGTELSHIKDIISSVWAIADKERSGLTVFINIRSYPAVLIFTAYGLGLVRSGRWQALHDLFSTRAYYRDHDEPERLVAFMFLWAWAGGDKDSWKFLEGLDRHKTPLSEHLFAVMTSWRSSFIGMTPDFEYLFEYFEVLGALVYLEMYSLDDLTQGLESGNPRYSSWTPMGRSGWHSATRNRILKDIQSPETQTKLLGFGYANGDDAFLEKSIANYQRLAATMAF
tara:strand:+ start:22134 stop:23918 length:1785 start_codon:yes stop_codon:yes gene_type:complete